MWFTLAQRVWAGHPVDLLDFGGVALMSALTLWICRTTYYVVTADDLLVRSSPFRKTVPLKSISALRGTRSARRGPALSLDRIEVLYGAKSLVVSPRDKPGFVRAIVERTPAVRPGDGFRADETSAR